MNVLSKILKGVVDDLKDRAVKEVTDAIPKVTKKLPKAIDPRKETEMETIGWLVTGGFAKGYRTQILAGLAFVSAVAAWAVGDMDTGTFVVTVFGSLGLGTLGAKINAK